MQVARPQIMPLRCQREQAKHPMTSRTISNHILQLWFFISWYHAACAVSGTGLDAENLKCHFQLECVLTAQYLFCVGAVLYLAPYSELQSWSKNSRTITSWLQSLLCGKSPIRGAPSCTDFPSLVFLVTFEMSYLELVLAGNRPPAHGRVAEGRQPRDTEASGRTIRGWGRSPKWATTRVGACNAAAQVNTPVFIPESGTPF